MSGHEKDEVGVMLEAAALDDAVLTSDKSTPATEAKRHVKPTQKAIEANYAKQYNARKGKLGQLTNKQNVLLALMVDYNNINLVKQEYNEFSSKTNDFKSLHSSVQQLLSEEEAVKDHEQWYKPKFKGICEFHDKVIAWMDNAPAAMLAQRPTEVRKVPPETVTDVPVAPEVTQEICVKSKSLDNVSVGVVSRNIATSSSSALRQAEAERAALVARAAALKQRQLFELQEAQLKAKKEAFELEIELAAADAKLKALDIDKHFGTKSVNPLIHINEYFASMQSLAVDSQKVDNYGLDDEEDDDDGGDEDDDDANDEDDDDDSDEYDEEQGAASYPPRRQRSHHTPSGTGQSRQPQRQMSQQRSRSRLPVLHQQPPQPNPNIGFLDGAQANVQAGVGMMEIMRKQNEITEMLIQEQKFSLLPSREIPVFKGDPLSYISFIRTFEHCIENKTSSYRDRLLFLEQFTDGPPKSIVRSCLHMDSQRGYVKAKRLLRKHFGNEVLIAAAYQEKIMNWDVIRSEDSKALHKFSLFLRTCCNAMSNNDILQDMNNPSHLKSVLSKLPYKHRERWRTVAYEYHERTHRRAKFPQLVNFIERQANIAIDPLFGEIQDTKDTKKDKRTNQTHKSVPVSSHSKSSYKSSFATVTESPEPKSQSSATNSTSMPQKTCFFCKGNHSTDLCKDLDKKMHKEKVEFFKANGLCFGCVTRGHLSKSCTKRLTCKICSKKHPSVLHIEFKKDADKCQVSPTSDSMSVSSALVTMETPIHTGAGDQQKLSIVPVKVKLANSNQILKTYAFLDPGSTGTFCTEALRKQLNAKAAPTRILLRTLGQEKVISINRINGLEVSSLEGSNFLKLPPLYTQTEIPVTKEQIPTQVDVQEWNYLKEVKLPYIDADIGLLIGNDAAKFMEPWAVINSKGRGPYAVKTRLGWVVNGLLNEPTMSHKQPTHIFSNRISIVNLNDLMIQQFNYDFPEKGYEEKAEMSIEDKRFMQIMSESAKMKDGHYQLNLPFKQKDIAMPNNRHLAEQRVMSLKRKFKKDPEFHKEYTDFLESVIQKGHAEAVPQKQLEPEEGRTWYLPHHGVRHPKKRKLRVVFDCSASFQGTSLNDELIQGPNLTNTLLGVLIRFRQEPVAMMADVEGMFHQVKVTPADKDFLRFLWWPNGDFSQNLVEYRMTVHLFGATSSSSVASYAVRRAAEDNKDRFSAVAVNTVRENFYVDDCLKSMPNETGGIELCKELRTLCAQGGFRLTKWISNSRTVLASIPEEERATEVKDIDLDQKHLPVERALGVQWNVEEDTFRIQVNLKNQPYTRRGILSTVSSVYDPLGFLAPFIFTAKHILQQLCQLNYGWDDRIPEAFCHTWHKWLTGLQQMENFSIPRCIRSIEFGKIKSAQLHHFCDASETGYGTVTYLKMTNAQNQINISLIMAKARVAPLKQVTIPRMELTAAVLAVKVNRMLETELQLPLRQAVFWTDSTSVLKYIRNDTKRFQTFVANRVGIIREHSSVKQWRYLNTKINPADHVSRGLTADAFLKCESWKKGPDFLQEREETWPSLPADLTPIPADDPEIKKEKVTVNTIQTTDQDATSTLIHHYSSFDRLKRAVAWMLHLKSHLLQLSRKRKELMQMHYADPDKQRQLIEIEMKRFKTTLRVHNLSLDELDRAETAIVQFCQKQGLREEIETLQKGSLNVRKDSSIYKLDPKLDEEVLRVGGRLSRSAMPETARHPAILPRDHHVSKLVLRKIHQQVGHSGRNHMLSLLRQKYWIPCANSLSRKIISECVICRRLNASVGEQKMADLPRDRITPDLPPFTQVGVDYFGPIEIKRGRTIVKRYGVIFTCLISRAVHLEVAHSLDTDSCINALRRFIARRGQVIEIRSDNGTNFISTEKELKESLKAWNLDKIERSLQQKGVKWTFNPPAGAHHGGVWERLIRLLKKTLLSVTKQQTLEDESLHTVMCEVEAILNSRPLTTVSTDPNDLEALTPNHLLTLKKQPILPPGVFQADDVYAKRRWRQVQYLSDLFWTRWIKEYLPLMNVRQKWNRIRRNFEKGDIVVIADTNAPRGSWMLARVLEATPDSRGLVRSVRLQTKTSVLDRPISKICLLVPKSN